MNHREIIFHAALIIIGILPVIFRRSILLRCVCVLLLLAAASVAGVGVELSAHSASDREAEASSQSYDPILPKKTPFKFGAIAAAHEAQESLPAFAIIIGALTLMALVPVKRKIVSASRSDPI